MKDDAPYPDPPWRNRPRTMRDDVREICLWVRVFSLATIGMGLVFLGLVIANL